MAVPRVFISSTYYDLKQVRNDVDTFIQSLGYEPVRHEKSSIPYTTGTLEEDCYHEISSCDIVICIIGKEYGTESKLEHMSITMKELKKALSEHKIVYVFVDRDVMCENTTYKANLGKDFTPGIVRDIKIHQSLIELENQIGRQRPIIRFEHADEIKNHLRDQLAGLFQRLIQKEATASTAKNAFDLHSEIANLSNLIDSIKEDHATFCAAFASSILVPNPVVRTLETHLGFKDCLLHIPNKNALDELMLSLSFEKYQDGECLIYSRQHNEKNQVLKIRLETFGTDGSLLFERDSKKRKELVSFEESDISTADDMPF